MRTTSASRANADLKTIVEDKPLRLHAAQTWPFLYPIRAHADFTFPERRSRKSAHFHRSAARRARPRRLHDIRASRLPRSFPPRRGFEPESPLCVLPVPPTVRFPTLMTVPATSGSEDAALITPHPRCEPPSSTAGLAAIKSHRNPDADFKPGSVRESTICSMLAKTRAVRRDFDPPTPRAAAPIRIARISSLSKASTRLPDLRGYYLHGRPHEETSRHFTELSMEGRRRTLLNAAGSRICVRRWDQRASDENRVSESIEARKFAHAIEQHTCRAQTNSVLPVPLSLRLLRRSSSRRDSPIILAASSKRSGFARRENQQPRAEFPSTSANAAIHGFLRWPSTARQLTRLSMIPDELPASHPTTALRRVAGIVFQMPAT